MYNPYYLPYGECIWNNIEGLIGEDSSFIVCRTMLKLPADKPDISNLRCTQKRNILEKNFAPTYPQEVSGQLMLDIEYEPINMDKGRGDKNGERIGLGINIPYRGVVGTKRHGKVFPQIKYLEVRQVGLRDVYVEGVIALVKAGGERDNGENMLKESFFSTDSFKLADSFPDLKEPIAAQINFKIEQQELKDGIVLLKGIKELFLMYVSTKKVGTKVIVAQENIPFSQEVYLNTHDGHIFSPDQTIIKGEIFPVQKVINIVNKRQVKIEGEYLLMFQPENSSQDKGQGAETPVVDRVEENETSGVKEGLQGLEASGNIVNLTAIGAAEEEIMEEEKYRSNIEKEKLMTKEAGEKGEIQREVSIVRESKKAKLAKYMKKS